MSLAGSFQNEVHERIILVGDYSRDDLLHVARMMKGQVDFYFIEFLNENEVKTAMHKPFGKAIYWKDYTDAYSLLENIRPSKVIFYFIESYNHVALNVAAKIIGIPTFHLEHGARFYVEGATFNEKSNDSIIKKISQNLLQFSARDIYDKYKNKKFFQNTIEVSTGEAKDFLRRFYNIRRKNGIMDTYRLLNENWRLPDRYISFSPLIFNYHKEVDRLPDDYPVFFTGIPMFDVFFQWNHLKNAGNDILFIDQPLHEQALMGWTKQTKLEFLEGISALVQSLGRSLIIKPHPWNDRSLYENLGKKVRIINDEWDAVIKDINAVLGFSSTLLMPFIAMEQMCCFTIEMHPVKGKKPYSQFFLDSGACHSISSFTELKENLSNMDHWHEKQKAVKAYFIDKWMYRFDGKSSERLRTILISSRPPENIL